MTLRKITEFYAKRNKRERTMIWGVVAAVAIVWISAETKGCSRANSEISTLESKKKLYENVILQGPRIQSELDAILKTFDASKTYSPVALQIAVENCARKSELSYSLSNAATKDAGRFKINTITLVCQRGALKNISAFEEQMRALEPYVMLSRASLDGNASGDVGAKYEISSFEMSAQ